MRTPLLHKLAIYPPFEITSFSKVFLQIIAYKSYKLICQYRLLSFFPEWFQLEFKVLFSFGQWMTSVDVLVYMTLFCFGKADLYCKNRKAKRKKTPRKCRSDFHTFSTFLSRVKWIVENILQPIINQVDLLTVQWQKIAIINKGNHLKRQSSQSIPFLGLRN